MPGCKWFSSEHNKGKSEGWNRSFGNWIISGLALILLIVVPSGTLEATGTADSLPICAIQGEGSASPYLDQQVRTQGIVTADLDNRQQSGFFIQSPDCDHSELTSDAIFVYLTDPIDLVKSGDLVEVTGMVHEYRGLTELLPEAGQVVVLSSGNPLPAAVDLNPPFNNEAATAYLESLEGMLVQITGAKVVGPSDQYGYNWVVRSDLGIERVFEYDPQGTGEVVAIGNSGVVSLSLGVKASDQINAVYGFLAEEDAVYPIQLLSHPQIIPGELPPIDGDFGNWAFSLATFNLHNLFDTYDDPGTADEVYTSIEYQRRLSKLAQAIHEALNEADLVVVQEAENDGVLRDLALRPEIETIYDIVWTDTPDPRGQDTALLFREDKFEVLAYQTHQGCTALIDGLGPDGNQDVVQPSNTITCDRDGDGELDGNRLFSRPVLVVRLQARGASGRDGAPLKLILLINHWKSKTEDTQEKKHTLLRRLEEAEFVVRLGKELAGAYPADVLIVAGDLNDVPDSEPVNELDTLGLLDLTRGVPKTRGYSLVYHGISQVLDYILVKPSLGLNVSRAQYLHINADYPVGFDSIPGTIYRASDHDPLLVHFVRFTNFSFLPVMLSGR